MISKSAYVEKHFPEIDPAADPCGPKILVQLRTVKKFTESGIALPETTRDFNNGNTRIAIVRKVGHIAFCNRETGKPWTEGVWAQVGDIIVIPAFGGFRYEIPLPDSRDAAIFATIPDTSVEMVIRDNFENFDRIL